MSKAIDELSKNLASGMSRRKALWRFASGVGAIGGLGLLTSKKALATMQRCHEEPLEIMFACFGCRSKAYEECLQEPWESETGCEEGDTACLEQFCQNQASCFYEVCLQQCGACPDLDSDVCDPEPDHG